ncbi:hypothetical protein SAMN05216371_0033 [Streptomyces sp. TLI_053]|uniref:hypothetical protein n=1 Tax=Streptomyces sp. TLI_053 TaxID=1855352 RepID=UPI000879FB4D|nr:hypothetical protein [Streptomyces sp. TLI_053]SDS49218.1 hypothetical protein SAMN05216371_0033 [Streptomyces sp. TLI_053]
MTFPVPAHDTALWQAAEHDLRTALDGRPLVAVERFASSGRTSYTGPAPIAAARPALAIGCYETWGSASPIQALTLEGRTARRGTAQRRTWTRDLDRSAQEVLRRHGRPVIAAWYATDRLRRWAGPRGTLAAVDTALRAEVEDKANFGDILDQAGVPAALHLTGARIDATLPALSELRRLVRSERVVVQRGADCGGRGTVFVDDEADLARAAEIAGPYRVTAFVAGWSANTTVLSVPDHAGRLRVYVDRPSHKAVGVPQAGIAAGKSAGNTWCLPWPKDAAARLVDAAVRIATWAWDKHRMKGLFGLDALLTCDGEVFLNEINCRNQGTTEVSAVNQQLRALPPFLIAHLTTMLDHPVTWLPDPDDFNAATVDLAAGCAPGPYYLKLRHRGQVPVHLGPHLGVPGVYRVGGGRLRWVRSGAHPADAGPGEVLLANLPAPGTVCEPGAELGTAEGIATVVDAPFAGPHTLSEAGRALLAAFDQYLVPADRKEGTAP